MTDQTINEVPLLPCPFCGRTEEKFHRYSRKLAMDIVQCIRCFCGAEINDYTAEGAFKLWNSRAPTTQAAIDAIDRATAKADIISN